MTDQAKLLDKRRAGILLHITSLPKTWGHGDIGGYEARGFVDFLHESGLSIWQILPIHPLSSTTDLSPYQPQSIHAGNPLLINLRWISSKGWLRQRDQHELSVQEEITFRQQRLRKAHEGFKKETNQEYRERYAEFKIEQKHWLDDYALFCALKDKFTTVEKDKNGEEVPNIPSWWEWPPEFRDRDKNALENVKNELADNIDYYCFEQFVFFEQWFELKKYANDKGVYILGDMPFFMASDSVDVWVNRKYFLLKEDGTQDFGAGDAPNVRYKDGQFWGNPLYNWASMQADDFSWWKSRFKTAHQLFDLVRITHFRGFVECCVIPTASKSPSDNRCHSIKSPGETLFTELQKEFGKDMSRWIAEDIGVRTEFGHVGEVVELRNKFDLIGMKVLQLAFFYLPNSDKLDLGNWHLPHHHLPNYAVYSGTHDNKTIRDWFNELGDKRDYVYRYLQISEKEQSDEQKLWQYELWYFIEMVIKSCAKLAIIPMQDILGLDGNVRMNKPGTDGKENWVWNYSLSEFEDTEKLYGFKVQEKLTELAKTYERQ